MMLALALIIVAVLLILFVVYCILVRSGQLSEQERLAEDSSEIENGRPI